MVEKILINTNAFVQKKITFSTKMTTFEKITAIVIFGAIVLLMFATIYTKSMVDGTNQMIESMRISTKQIEQDSRILQQKIDHLLTTDRIEAVAKNYGLTRDMENVKSIQNDH